MLLVLYADIADVPTEPDGLPLSGYRLERLKRLRPALSRRQSIGAELLLIRALQRIGQSPQLPLAIAVEPGGKPTLRDGSLHFSLSHSGSFAACAIADRPLGLDIEETAPCNEAILHRFFSAEEGAFIWESPDRDCAFTRIWTQKESVLKATGQGMTVRLSAVDVLTAPWRDRIWHAEIQPLHFALCTLEGDPRPDSIQKIELP